MWSGSLDPTMLPFRFHFFAPTYKVHRLVRKLSVVLAAVIQLGCFNGRDYLPPSTEYVHLGSYLSIMNEAEMLLFRSTGRYGDITELEDSNTVVWETVGRIGHEGYTIDIKVKGNNYGMRIYPKANSSVLSMYSDERKIMRFGWGTSDLAGPSSRVWSGGKV